MGEKSRLNWGTGATECSPNCRCNMCRLEGKGVYDRTRKTGVSEDDGVQTERE